MNGRFGDRFDFNRQALPAFDNGASLDNESRTREEQSVTNDAEQILDDASENSGNCTGV